MNQVISCCLSFRIRYFIIKACKNSYKSSSRLASLLKLDSTRLFPKLLRSVSVPIIGTIGTQPADVLFQ